MACLALSACALWSQALFAEVRIFVRNVATRPGVTVPVLVIRPDRPVGTILLFPGGAGRVTFRQDGTTNYRGFPIRKPELFAQRGFMTAVIDAASDAPAYIVRDTAEHAEDVRQVLAMLRKEADVPLWLVGHSAGSTSVANAAINLRKEGPDGIVLMSSKNGKPDRRSGNLDGLNIESITVPALVVHHEEDECEYTLFINAKRLMGRLKNSAKSELISFKGGGPVAGDPCGSLHYHGFPGLEQEVVPRITEWIKATLKP